MPFTVQPSFAHGEISDDLYGRVDVAAFKTALRTARNVVIRPYGGAANRAGLQFLGFCTTMTGQTRLRRFRFNASDTYMLAFSDMKLRIIRGDAFVTEAAKNITGATQANPCVLTINSHGWSVGDDVVLGSIGGMTQLNGRQVRISAATTNTITLQDIITGTGINSTGFGAYTSGGTAARVYTVASPYAEADLDQLKFVQSADVMTITHPSYAIRELSRTGDASWTFSAPSMAPTIAAPTGVSAAVTHSLTQQYKITQTTGTTESNPSAALSITDGGDNTVAWGAVAGADYYTAYSATENGDFGYLGRTFGTTFRDHNLTPATSQRPPTAGTGTVPTISSVVLTNASLETQTYVVTAISDTGEESVASASASIVNGALAPDNTVSWSAVAGATKYSVYRAVNGLYALIGTTPDTSFRDENTQPDLTTGPPSSKNPFASAGDYPAASGYYEQRQVYGGSDNAPDTSNYSVIASRHNFSTSSPTQPADAITATLTAREVNVIRHYVPLNDLIVFTVGAEWRVNANSTTGFAADTIQQKPQSGWGCSHLEPIVVGVTVLFVPESQQQVRSLAYTYVSDQYSGEDVTVLANHLFRDHKLTSWGFGRDPWPVVYGVRADGQAAVLTFQQEQQVVAWARWDTDGYFEAVDAVRPSASEPYDRPYFVVRRKVNDYWVRYIEREHDREFTDVRDAFFVDSGLSYDNPATITDAALSTPIVISAPSHGFSNGDEVDIFDIEWTPLVDEVDNVTQPDQLNGYRFTVANATADTFELVGTDGTLFTQYYVAGGTARKAVNTVSGLDHLEARTVVALCDGNVVSDLVVSGGSVTLPRKFSRVHVGLRFISDLETLDVPPAEQVMGRLRRLPVVVLRFSKSRGLYVGQSTDDLMEVKWREFEDLGNPTDLLTGDKVVTNPSTFDRAGRLFMRQRYPLPMHLLAAVPDVEVSD